MELDFLFFDFGGCIDAPGVHARTLFWEAFFGAALVRPGARAEFQEAYTRADQAMMDSGSAKNLGLRDFNRLNARLIGESFGLMGAEKAADLVTRRMDGHLRESREALRALAGRYPLGMISNFTGNLEVILREYGLRELFVSVTESFYVGAAKPDPRIFAAALATQKFPASRCLFVGDNPVNDIEPAKKLGFRTALIHEPGKRRDCGADFYVEDLRSLSALIQSK